jgi:predicted Zn finger-like uncharacterized protein
MVVTCSNCRARYAVDPLAIGPGGRTVQCARCDHRWFEKVEGPAPAPDVVIRPATPGAGLPAVIAPRPQFGWRRLVAVAMVILALLGAALFAFRHEITTMMSYEARASTSPDAAPAKAIPQQQATAAPPPVAPRPAPPPAPATAPAAPTAQPAPQSVVRATNAQPARPMRPGPADIARPQIEVDLSTSKIDVVDGRYVVRGQLVNNGKAPGSTTLLRLTFKRNEDVLGERSFALVQGPLPPGGRAPFSQTLDDPPSGTTDIVPVVE